MAERLGVTMEVNYIIKIREPMKICSIRANEIKTKLF